MPKKYDIQTRLIADVGLVRVRIVRMSAVQNHIV
jgi:hypothetical protein